tara:strand:- start:221 stop:622 length:402 start_codon:yes stop_codon:yes gene_type:complete
MPRVLKILIITTDIQFLLYWVLSALYLAGLITLPEEMLFANYHDGRVFAWNWSFLPLDLVFSISGLLAVRAAARGDRLWRSLAMMSLLLSSAAGGMAISYWIILSEYNLSWFLPNLILFLWPLPFLRQLIKEI